MAWIVAKAEDQLMKQQKGWIAPVAWSSHRLKRVATSTLLAELIAIAESLAEAEWLLHWEGLVLGFTLSSTQASRTSTDCDNKAAYDIVEAEKPTFSGVERKAALEAIA
eukprot:2970975-Amphidinium_carterae.1